MNTLLSIAEKDYAFNLFEQGYNLGEVALFGLMILGIGILTVFAVLSLIWLALILFEKIFAKSQNKPARTVEETIVPVQETTTLTQTNDEEIIAVIAAAIAMAESESNGLKFRVVSFKRK